MGIYYNELQQHGKQWYNTTSRGLFKLLDLNRVTEMFWYVPLIGITKDRSVKMGGIDICLGHSNRPHN